MLARIATAIPIVHVCRSVGPDRGSCGDAGVRLCADQEPPGCFTSYTASSSPGRACGRAMESSNGVPVWQSTAFRWGNRIKVVRESARLADCRISYPETAQPSEREREEVEGRGLGRRQHWPAREDGGG